MGNYIELTNQLIKGFKVKKYSYLARELDKKLIHIKQSDSEEHKHIFTEIIKQIIDHFEIGLEEAQRQLDYIFEIGSFFKEYGDSSTLDKHKDLLSNIIIDFNKHNNISLSKLYQEYKEFILIKEKLRVLILSLSEKNLIEKDKQLLKIMERWNNEK